MLMIGQLITALVVTLNAAMMSPANATVPAGVCGEGPIAAGSACELLTGDSCTAACDATDWAAFCAEQCCEEGADYGAYGECDPKCASACEYNSWGDCTFNWCGGGNVLFCEGQPKATDGGLDACLDYLCEKNFGVEGLTCDAPEDIGRNGKKRG